MAGFNDALGSNAAIYEAVARSIVGVIDAAEVPLEVGVIALKAAQLIFDARVRDSWDTAWTNIESASISPA